MQLAERTSRRRVLFALGGTLGAAVALLAACGGSSAPAAGTTAAPAAPTTAAAGAPTAVATPAAAPTTAAVSAAPTTAPVASGQKQTLSFWGHQDHPMDVAQKSFAKLHPDVNLDWQHLGDWLTKFKATLASGSGVPDLVWLEATDVQNFGAKGVLLDITQRLAPNKDQFAPGKVTEVTIQKKKAQVAMPGDIGLVALWYRPDLLQKAGIKEVPADLSYDTYYQMAAELQKAGTAAFLLPSAGWSWPFEIILSQAGGSITSLDGTQVTIDDAKGVQAMNVVKSLWQTKANLDVKWLSPDYWAAVKAGKIAADFMPAWMRGFAESELKSEADGLGKWQLAPLPAVKGGVSQTAQIGGASLASTTFTKVPDLVWQFMQYSLGSMDGATDVGGWGIIPSYLPYLSSTQFSSIKSTLFGDFPWTKTWATLAPQLSTTYARTAVFSDADGLITQDIMPMLDGKVAVEAGMKALGDKVRQANDRYQ